MGLHHQYTGISLRHNRPSRDISMPWTNRPLFRWGDATHARASDATVGFGRAGESAATYGSGVKRLLPYTGSPCLVVESAATYNILRNTAIDTIPPWDISGGQNTPVGDTVTSPTGATDADTLNLTGTGTDIKLASPTQAVGGTPADTFVLSVWAKRVSTNQTFCIWDAGTHTDQTTSQWKRGYGNVAFGAGNNNHRIDNRTTTGGPGTPADLYVWGWGNEQGLEGKRYPSSFVPTAGATATRVADTVSLASADVPAAIKSGRYGFAWWPLFGDADVLGANYRTLWQADTASGDYLRYESLDDTLKLYIAGVAVLSTATLTFTRLQPLLVLVDMAESSLQVIGATGGAKVTGAAGQTLGTFTTMYWGSNGGSSGWADSAIGQPFPW